MAVTTSSPMQIQDTIDDVRLTSDRRWFIFAGIIGVVGLAAIVFTWIDPWHFQNEDMSKVLSVTTTRPSPSKAPIIGERYYTVQLVTYYKQEDAQEEVERLSAKGFDAFILPSGRYYRVCAGKLSSTAEAKGKLSQIGAAFSGVRYPDAFIRSVKHTQNIVIT